jgi:hypothetical protein
MVSTPVASLKPIQIAPSNGSASPAPAKSGNKSLKRRFFLKPFIAYDCLYSAVAAYQSSSPPSVPFSFAALSISSPSTKAPRFSSPAKTQLVSVSPFSSPPTAVKSIVSGVAQAPAVADDAPSATVLASNYAANAGRRFYLCVYCMLAVFCFCRYCDRW